ncbi:MAG: plastocyanin/azurin family copper-binding protein [Planctomycetia bacterium]|nr:plastocyanin/azurin family copper-binding protein [Planctomycetia bacterium]
MKPLLLTLLLLVQATVAFAAEPSLYARENLVAWCIVPFDAARRGPEERAAMLERMGIKQFAYDWRDEHIPTFDEEVAACARHGVKITAWWTSGPELNEVNRRILDVARRHQLKLQFWVMMGEPAAPDQAGKVQAAAEALRPFTEEAAKLDCQVGLYNHGGWFGEPENQLAIIEALRMPNVGIVYNQHHGHAHVDRFAALLEKLKPHLLALNLNGMVRDGEANGQKIVPIGAGELDLDLLRTIEKSGYRGPIGILNHTELDAEARLLDNLDGLEWLNRQLRGEDAGPRPTYRSYEPPAVQSQNEVQQTLELLANARVLGNFARGAAVFASTKFACNACHKVGVVGGTIGPDLSSVGVCLRPEEIAESLLWPKRKIKPGYEATAIATSAGHLHQGYVTGETDEALDLRIAATQEIVIVAKGEIEERQEIGTLMPDGLAEAMTAQERHDVLKFLLDLGRGDGSAAAAMLAHAHQPAEFEYDFAPLEPNAWPHREQPVNRDRLYDFYAKQAEHFRQAPNGYGLLAPYPGMDGGRYGHWGNQSEATWADDRWNATDLGSLQCGVFHADELVVPRAVCVRLGERGELAACFNPDTLQYEAVWDGGFVRFSSVRHGFMDGLLIDGKRLAHTPGEKPAAPFRYLGFHRYGKQVLFRYRIGEVEYLDAPGVNEGAFTCTVAPLNQHPLRHLIAGGPSQWPQELTTRGELGSESPYALDTITVPAENPWKAPMFFGGHDFLPNGTARLCTMQGDVWNVTGLDGDLGTITWRRFAAGLHHAQGVVVHDGQTYVLGRDQITRLHDLNQDGEADYYECFSNVYATSSAGHDFICGLERDAEDRFYVASGNEGLLRISADGLQVDCLARGFRNPDGLGLFRDGSVTVPCSEGEWTATSMICQIPSRMGDAASTLPIDPATPPFYGYGGPRTGFAPNLPLVYLPRGLDNSAGGQLEVTSSAWGPLQGAAIHFSYGTGNHFLLLRDETTEGPIPGQVQGAVVPLPGDFLSGAHRGRFAPHDGQLYVTGMGGWGTYTIADGSFQRVRFTGAQVQLPVKYSVRSNGILVTFSESLDPATATIAENHFAQAWNYRYSSAYGSQEFSISHPDTPAHDRMAIASAHVLPDGKTLFLEMRDMQPVNQLHLRLKPDSSHAVDMFLTVHGWSEPFTEFPGYAPREHAALPHPLLADLARLNQPKLPNPWRESIVGARDIDVAAGKNLTFATSSFTVRAGEPLAVTFTNPDVVPHNWVLLRPGSMPRVGDLVNKLVAVPEAAARQYIPETDDVLAYVDVTSPAERETIYFTAPTEPGRYPFICSFPGHWMVMNGQMIVEAETP